MRVRRPLFALLILAVVVLIAVSMTGHWDRSQRSFEDSAEPSPADGRDASEVETAGASQPTLVGVKPPEGSAHAERAPTGSLKGQVLVGAYGGPLHRAMLVAFRPKGYEGVRIAHTDESGQFELTDLAPGPWWLIAWHPLYVPAGLEEWLRSPAGSPGPDILTIDVPVEGGALPDRVIRLVSGRRIEGRVVDAKGAPVPGVQIRPFGTGWRRVLESRFRMRLYGWEKYLPLRSDADGRFALACLPRAVENVRLAAYKPGFACRWCDPLSADPRERPARIVLVLLETATVTGHVRAAGGQSTEGAEVGLDNAWALRKVWAFERPDDATVTADGSYRLEGLPPASVELDADWADPYMAGSSAVLDALQPGEVRLGVDFTLGERYVLRARLRTATGAPLPKERLFLRWAPTEEDAEDDEDDDDTLDYEWTQDDGRVVFALPSAGPYELVHARPRGDRVRKAGITLPCDELELVSESSIWTRIELRVFGPDGAPVPRFRSSVWSQAGDARRNELWFDSDEDGREGVARHRVHGVAPLGVLVGQAAGESGRSLDLMNHRGQIREVPANGVVEIRLGRAGVLVARFVDTEGRPVAGVRLRLVTAEDEESSEVVVPMTDPGTFEYEVPLAGGAEQKVAVDVPPGFVGLDTYWFRRTAPRREFVLLPAGRISGRVVAPESVDVAGKELLWVRWDGFEGGSGSLATSEYVTVGEDGRFEATHVPLDRDLIVSARPWVVRPLGLQVPPQIQGVRAGARNLEIRLVPGLSIRGTISFAGDPPDSCAVLAIPHEAEEVTAFVALRPDGGFELTGLKAGRYRFLVWGHEGESTMHLADRQTEAGANLKLRIGPRGDINIRVVGELDYASVTAWRTGTVSRAGTTNCAESAAVLQGLPTAHGYDIVVADYGGVVGTCRNAQVGEEVTIELAEAVPLGGLLTTDLPLGHANLFARSESGCFDLMIGDDGEFDERVAPGRYDLILVERDGTQHVVARNVEAGRDDYEFTLR